MNRTLAQRRRRLVLVDLNSSATKVILAVLSLLAVAVPNGVGLLATKGTAELAASNASAAVDTGKTSLGNVYTVQDQIKADHLLLEKIAAKLGVKP